MITVGVDVGSTAAKAVVFDGGIRCYTVEPTGWSPRSAGKSVFTRVLTKAGITARDVGAVVATGYGRLALDFADRAVTEITCHARGAAYLLPGNSLVIDVGGQDSKAILVDSHGKVLKFVMNDKCAAGTGRFLQVMADSLGIEVGDLGTTGLDLEEPVAGNYREVEINSMCTVFAESEVVGLLARGVAKEAIVRALHRAVARRVAAMAGGLGPANRVTFTGGAAKNRGLKEALHRELGLGIDVPEEPQIIGALGAALIAREG